MPSANAEVPAAEETAQPEEEDSDEAGAVEATAVPEDTVDEPEPTPVPVEESVASSEETDTTGTVCVSVYDDGNADGVQDGGEAILADAAITLSQGGNTVATYVSDGVNEPYCFANLDEGTYQVQLFPPANYMANSIRQLGNCTNQWQYSSRLFWYASGSSACSGPLPTRP